MEHACLLSCSLATERPGRCERDKTSFIFLKSCHSCQLRGVNKLVFFPLEDDSINLQKQVCVDTCPKTAGEAVNTFLKPERRLGSLLDAVLPLDQARMTATTGGSVSSTTVSTSTTALSSLAASSLSSPEGSESSWLMGGVVGTAIKAPDMEETTVMGYPSFEAAGLLCMPDFTRYEGNVSSLIGESIPLQIAFQVSELWNHQEILAMAAGFSCILALVFLCAVDNCAVLLVTTAMAPLVLLPAAYGAMMLLNGHVDGEMGRFLGSFSRQNEIILGILALAVSLIMLVCLACQGGKITEAALAVKESAGCLMSMPVLLLEPFISLLLKLALFIAGYLTCLVLMTSGDFRGHVDLTQPGTFFHPTVLSTITASHCFLACLILLDLLHYISAFLAIYATEVWFLKLQYSSRRSFCQFSGVGLLLQAFRAALTHLGSLVYASILLATLRPIRWLMSGFLAAEAAASSGNAVAECLLAGMRCFVHACIGCFETLGLQRSVEIVEAT